MDQPPLRLALQPRGPDDAGRYTIDIPRSVCFGHVVAGGALIAAASLAASDFVSHNARSKPHAHVLHVTTNFLRPVFARPAELHMHTLSVARAQTTLSVEIFQNEKRCTALIFTMSNLTPSRMPTDNPASTGWSPQPPPIPCSMNELESDASPGWISYRHPLSLQSDRAVQSYVRFHIPAYGQTRLLADQWVCPAWNDPDPAHNPPVWTDNLLHFLVDMAFPLFYGLVEPERKSSLYDSWLAAGRAQQAVRRAAGGDRSAADQTESKNLPPSGYSPHFGSTLVMSTEIKRLLPVEGERYLFMRATTKELRDGRTDLEVVVMDRKGQLVAVSNQLMQIVSVADKKERTKTANL